MTDPRLGVHPNILKSLEDFLRARGVPEESIGPAIDQLLPELKKHVSEALGDPALSEGLSLLVHRSVGQGITQWAKMEESLVQIAAKLLGTTEEKAGLVLYSISNFHMWINIIDELFVFDASYPNSLKMWRKLIETLKTENDLRVRLAHHSMAATPVEQFLETGSFKFGGISPSQLDRRGKTKPMKPLAFDEIDDFSRRIAKLHGKLTSLLQMMGQPESSR